MDNKQHWEKVFTTKQPHEVSWTQDVPKTSLDLILKTGVAKGDPIIDIGGGDSLLVDHLLGLGYTDVSVLDISGEALKRAQSRLGKYAAKVQWIESDIRDFLLSRTYAIWHDRAAFHFLTDPADIQLYATKVAKAVTHSIIMGTFSEQGPEKCSGLVVCRYSETAMRKVFEGSFRLNECFTEDHTTPFNTIQNFRFGWFIKKELLP
ncbi:class I SAM-dependent methyltransferase [soil metagenome]